MPNFFSNNDDPPFLYHVPCFKKFEDLFIFLFKHIIYPREISAAKILLTPGVKLTFIFF